MSAERLVLPLVPLRDIVVFPFMVLPLFVGREKSELLPFTTRSRTCER